MGVSYLGLRMWDCMFAVLDGERLVNIIVLSGYLMPFLWLWPDQLAHIAITCAAWVDHKTQLDFHILLIAFFDFFGFCNEVFLCGYL